MVVAEMVAGILLGPSALGRIPNWQYTLFPASSISLLSIVSNLGLVLFMFVVGLELDVKLLRKSGRSSTISSVVGVIVPFVFGVPLAFALNSPEFHSTSLLVFYFFMSIVVGISALPVLARFAQLAVPHFFFARRDLFLSLTESSRSTTF
jgi:Kef-type K+ transport system membrane component KefB